MFGFIKRGLTATVVAAACGGILGVGTAAAETERDTPIDDFASDIRQSAENGDDSAREDLEKLGRLDADQRETLNDYLSGNLSVNLAEAEVVDGVMREGDFTREVESGSGNGTAFRSAGEKYVQSTDAFRFAGITITETKVAGSYAVTGGKASGINSHQCEVVKNYDPLAQVSSSKGNAYTQGGNATFLCTVNVNRGVPTPWDRINWSERSATQGVVGDGAGRVINEGWM